MLGECYYLGGFKNSFNNVNDWQLVGGVYKRYSESYHHKYRISLRMQRGSQLYHFGSSIKSAYAILIISTNIADFISAFAFS